MKSELGLGAGIGTVLTGEIGEAQPVFLWLRAGSRLEDSPGCRATHHFHDPLKPFDQAAVSDMGFTVGGFALERHCLRELPSFLPGVTRFRSNVTWATRFTDPASKGDAIGNPFDWDAARAAYGAALTQSTTSARDTGLAETFQALGHVLHLVQDVAVPAHVRNDFTAHLEVCASVFAVLSGQVRINDACGNSFERFVRRRFDLVDTATPVVPPAALSTRPPRFWDTNQYTGATPSADLAQGLAEYTNANFLSGTSLFEDADPLHRYPHPAKASTNLATYLADPPAFPVGPCRAPDGGLDTVRYLAKTAGGEPIPTFLKVGFLTQYNPALVGLALPPTVAFQFDDCVHTAYAEKLLPRAIGYSAALLDYFFRGRLRVVQLVPSTTSVEADLRLPQANDTGPAIDTVTVWLLNASRSGDQPERIVPDPQTGRAGTLSLSARYEVGGTEQATSFVLRDPATFTGLPHEDDGAAPVPLAFVLAAGDPVPPTARNLTYTLVFQGTLGAEAGAVIGRVLTAPMLERVSLRAARMGVPLTATGDGIDAATEVRFSKHFPTVTTELPRTDPESITVLVPDGVGVAKPGAGGIRLRKTLATGEVLFSNPVPFTPIAEGSVVNGGDGSLTLTLEALGPIIPGAPEAPPPARTLTLGPRSALALELPTGFRYATTPPSQALPPEGLALEFLTPGADDFTFVF